MSSLGKTKGESASSLEGSGKSSRLSSEAEGKSKKSNQSEKSDLESNDDFIESESKEEEPKRRRQKVKVKHTKTGMKTNESGEEEEIEFSEYDYEYVESEEEKKEKKKKKLQKVKVKHMKTGMKTNESGEEEEVEFSEYDYEYEEVSASSSSKSSEVPEKKEKIHRKVKVTKTRAKNRNLSEENFDNTDNDDSSKENHKNTADEEEEELEEYDTYEYQTVTETENSENSGNSGNNETENEDEITKKFKVHEPKSNTSSENGSSVNKSSRRNNSMKSSTASMTSDSCCSSSKHMNKDQNTNKTKSYQQQTYKTTNNRKPQERSCRPFTTRTSTPRKRPDEYDLTTVTALSSQVYQGYPLSTDDPDLIAAVIYDLMDMRYKMEVEKKFDESVKVELSIERLRQQQLELMKQIYSNDEFFNVNQKLENAHRDLEEYDNKSKSRTNQLNFELNELVKGMTRKHEQEIERHEQQWKSAQKQREYNRTSGKVRAMRLQQQKMLNSKRYQEAEQVRRIADNVCQSESRSAFDAMQTKYQESLELLLKRQSDEMNTLMIANQTRRESLKFQIERGRKPIILRIEQLSHKEELAKKPERVWAYKHKTESGTITQRMGMGKEANVMSARHRIQDFNTMTLPPLQTEPIKRSIISRRSSRF